MQKYMLLMSGKSENWKRISPDEKQRLMSQYYEFVEMLRNKNGFIEGSALNQAGFHLKNSKEMDGPFSETKEVLNGYMLFKASNFEEALNLAKKCPVLTHGESIQIFEVND